MPRRKLTAKEKQVMQEARVTTKQQRDAALQALAGNPQFTNPKFWKLVDPAVIADVERALAKAKDASKRARIAKLEAELATLRN